jgi:subtilisin family serine protease
MVLFINVKVRYFLILIIFLSFLQGALGQNQAEKKSLPNDFFYLRNAAGQLVDTLDLGYYHALGIPKAWQYTTGNSSVLVGLSDARVDPNQLDFAGKTRILKSVDLQNGHGMGVAAIAVAQGDNDFGIPGVCYDCGLVTTNYGNPNMEMLLELADAGAKVINCSWVTSIATKRGQEVIDTLLKRGVVVVAGAGNKNWTTTEGQKKYYPASYDGVISVSSVMYQHKNWEEALKYEETGKPYVENMWGLVGRTAAITHKKTGPEFRIYPQSTATLNTEVDLLAPTVGVMRYSKWATEGTLSYNTYQGTSTAAPFVTGTIGLMFSLRPELRANEVETILRLTALNIDHIQANAPYKGHYGAGMLQSGAALTLVDSLYDPEGIAVIKHQKIDRWSQTLTAFNRAVLLRDIEFTGQAAFELRAKNQILLQPGTRLAPENDKGIKLVIDSDINFQP